MSHDYKLAHEAFMQNHTGTGALDTFITIVPTFFTPCIVKYIVLSMGILNDYVKLSLEFLIIIVPLVFYTTIVAEYRIAVVAAFALLFAIVHLRKLYNIRQIWELKVQHKKEWFCISYIRALTSMITIHCILAVDFNIYPRYFAKTEKYGYSLMDVGVGLFVFVNGLVPSKISKYGLYKSIEQNAKPCIILLILGYLRVMVLNEIDYHQHVTEYGLHWNFFITLAITKLIGVIILHIFKESNALIGGFILMLSHELLLYKGIRDWVFSDLPRDNFIIANREGIGSMVGYVALFLISTHIGQVIRERYYCKSESKVLNTLLVIVFVSWALTYLSSHFFVASRCLANLGYCSFVVAIGLSITTLFYIYELSEASIKSGDKYYKDKIVKYNFPIIFHAINQNGLLFFLVGNMVTGLINMLFQTIYLNTVLSLIVIFLYLIFVTMGIVGWERRKIRKRAI